MVKLTRQPFTAVKGQQEPLNFGDLDWASCVKVANRVRYSPWIWPEEGRDFVQDALVEMMERARRNGGGLSEKEMWRAARCVRNRYWRAYQRERRPLSLNAPIEQAEGPIELWETLADQAPDLESWLDARLRLGEVPLGILRIGRKLEKGEPLTRGQRDYLARFRHDGQPSPQRAWSMRRYHALRSRGLCVRCGEESDGFARCPRCREAGRAYQGKYRRRKGKPWQRHLRRHWRRKGLCWRCGRPPESGYKLCPHCRQKNKEYLKRYKEGRPGLWKDWYALHREEYNAKRREKRRNSRVWGRD